MKSSRKAKVEALMRAVRGYARDFAPICSKPTDIGFI
jgi:hypothetical protein